MGAEKTIIAASLDDSELKKSIDGLVSYYKDSLGEMGKATDEEILGLQTKLAKLGTTKIDSSGSSDGGSSKRAKAQNAETQEVEANVAARSKQIKTNKEAEVSFDQLNAGLQKATANERRYTDEIRKQAEEIRKSKDFREKGIYTYTVGDFDYKIHANSKRSVEEQLIENQARINREIEIQKENEAALIARTQEKTRSAKDYLAVEEAITRESSKRTYKSPIAETDFSQARMFRVIAQKAGLENWEVVRWDEQASSIKKMSEALSQYRSAYENMSNEERTSPIGKQMISDIHVLERTIKQARNEMSRPINLEQALNLPTKTIDDITYKIQQLQAYKRGINIADPKQVGEINQVDRAINGLQKDLNKYMDTTRNVREANTALGRSWNYMKNRLAFYFTVGVSTALVKNLIEVRSQYELLDRSIGILINDARKGTEIFNQLNAMAIKSPFTTMELGAAAKQLVAFNIAGDDVVDTTRRIADMAAAIGVPMERLTYALGQVKTYGYLNSRDARIFLNAGIPIIQMLTDMYNRQRSVDEQMLTSSQVREMMTKRLISYADVMKVVNEATNEGGKFFNFQEKAANTLKIQLANLNLAWNTMLNDIGKDSQGFLSSSISAAKNLIKSWREISRVLATLVVGIGAYRTATMLAGLTTVKMGGVSLMSWLSLARGVRSAGDAVALFSLTIKSIPFVGWATAIASLLSYFVFFNDTIGDTGRKIQELTKSFDELGKQFADLFSKAMTTNNLNEQIESLRGMIDKAQSELGVTIPVNLEDVDEGNIKEKIQEVKRRIDEYLAFTEQFGKTATESNLEKGISDFGTAANNIFNSITNNLSLVKQGMLEAGYAAKDVKLLDKQEGESTIAYLERIISLYEKIGLVGREKTMPITLEGESDPTNWGVLVSQQSRALDKLNIKNREVFVSMLHVVQEYYKGLGAASTSFDKFANELAKKVDVNSIVDKEQRTLKVSAALDKFASENSINNAALEMLRNLANKKYGIDIPIGIDQKSGNQAEQDLKEWQKRLQEQADKNGIKLSLSFTDEQSEESYANEALNQLKEGLNRVEVLKRKQRAGTATQDDVNNATNAVKRLREQARLAGADLESLNKKSGGSKQDPLGDAVQKNIQYVNEIRKKYEEYRKEGLNTNEALEEATKHYSKSLARVNQELSKYGIQGLTGEQLATMNLQQVRDYFQGMLNGAQGSAKAVEALEKALAGVDGEIIKFRQKAIIDGLNSELSKLKDEYELAVELDADPEMGSAFAQLFDIDPNQLPKNLEDYAKRATDILNRYFKDDKIELPTIDLTDDDLKAYKAILGEDKYKILESYTKDYKSRSKKETQDIVKQTKDLQYKLADTNGKIAIEEEKLKDLQVKWQKETNAEKKELLALQIKDQQNAIAKLKESLLQELPAYQKLFGSIADHSARMTRKLAKDYMTILDNAQMDENKNYVITDGDKRVTFTQETYYKEVKRTNNEMRKSQDVISQIGEAFTKGTDDEVDFWHGIELIGGEMQKLGNIAKEIGGFAEMLGADEETLEVINDIGASIDGAAKATQGMAQIANGDILGGAANVISGLTQTISTWLDNSDKKITRKVEESVRQVKRLENTVSTLKNAYDMLSNSAERAYGTQKVGADMALQSSQKMQLQMYQMQKLEVQRQLQLEKSRSKKKRDEDRIIDLQGQLISLQSTINGLVNDVANAVMDITDELLGISRSSWAEELTNALIDVFKKGEDYMDVFEQSWDDMVEHLIIKMISARLIGDYMDKYVFGAIDEIIKKKTEKESAALADRQKNIQSWETMGADEITNFIKENNTNDIIRRVAVNVLGEDSANRLLQGTARLTEKGAKEFKDAMLEILRSGVDKLEEDLDKASLQATKDAYEEVLRNPNTKEGAKGLIEGLPQWLEGVGIKFGQDAESGLSSLQAGISSITETTANALEAYMNGVSQQVYLQSDLMTQIRDAVVAIDSDVQTSTQAQMLLQLQQSYQVQMSIQMILEGVLTPSGRAFSVELIS